MWVAMLLALLFWLAYRRDRRREAKRWRQYNIDKQRVEEHMRVLVAETVNRELHDEQVRRLDALNARIDKVVSDLTEDELQGALQATEEEQVQYLRQQYEEGDDGA